MTPRLKPALADRDRLGSVALDQWRGLALVLVLVSHGFYFTGRAYGVGRVGVNLFFFISGILVFRSLSRSRAASDWDRTRSFWWRRFRRLYPALLSYTLLMLGAVWVLQRLPNLPEESDFATYVRGIPLAITYTINYENHPASALSHLWSLACEMQFYLVAPVIYWVGGTAPGRRTAVFGVVLLLLVAFGMAQPFFGTGKYHFEFAVWPMMLGFCCEYRREWFSRLPEKLVTAVLWSSGPICAATVLLMLAGLEMKLVVVAVGAWLLAPCLVAYLYGRPVPGSAGTSLRWLGERTYSIYLWQQPFTLCEYLPSMLHPLGAAIAVAVGGVWFHFFERPFLSSNRRH